MTAGEYFSLKEHLGDHRTVLEDEYFLELRMVKDEWEIEATREAIRRAEAGFDRLIPRLKIGMTEKDLADELHYLVNREGAEAMSFGTIVASGARGAMAHGFPTNKVIENGDMVVVDFGAMYDGYCSDMTRTLLFGDISQENRRILDVYKRQELHSRLKNGTLLSKSNTPPQAAGCLPPRAVVKWTCQHAHLARCLRENK